MGRVSKAVATNSNGNIKSGYKSTTAKNGVVMYYTVSGTSASTKSTTKTKTKAELQAELDRCLTRKTRYRSERDALEKKARIAREFISDKRNRVEEKYHVEEEEWSGFLTDDEYRRLGHNKKYIMKKIPMVMRTEAERQQAISEMRAAQQKRYEESEAAKKKTKSERAEAKYMSTPSQAQRAVATMVDVSQPMSASAVRSVYNPAIAEPAKRVQYATASRAVATRASPMATAKEQLVETVSTSIENPYPSMGNPGFVQNPNNASANLYRQKAIKQSAKSFSLFSDEPKPRETMLFEEPSMMAPMANVQEPVRIMGSDFPALGSGRTPAGLSQRAMKSDPSTNLYKSKRATLGTKVLAQKAKVDRSFDVVAPQSYSAVRSVVADPKKNPKRLNFMESLKLYLDPEYTSGRLKTSEQVANRKLNKLMRESNKLVGEMKVAKELKMANKARNIKRRERAKRNKVYKVVYDTM